MASGNLILTWQPFLDFVILYFFTYEPDPMLVHCMWCTLTLPGYILAGTYFYNWVRSNSTNLIPCAFIINTH